MELSYAKTAEEVLEYFSVKESEGLNKEEVEIRRKKYGPNGKHLYLTLGRSRILCVCKTIEH